MAEQENILTRLGKLLQSSIVVRKTDSGQLKVKDVDFSQQGLTSNFIDRYNRLMNGASWAQKYAAGQNRSGYDVARGDGKDYSACQVFEVDDMEQVAEYKGQLVTTDYGNF